MILVLLFHDTRSNDVRFMHKLAKHTYRKWNMHLENHTVQNNRSICRSMWTHFFPEMAWNLAVFFKLIKGFLKAYWISTLHCRVFFLLKNQNKSRTKPDKSVYLFIYATLFENFSTGFSLWILPNFEEPLFHTGHLQVKCFLPKLRARKYKNDAWFA